MEILVINLDRSPDRMAFMAKQLDDLGCAFTRLPATDGSAISDEDVARFAGTYMRPLTRTELACLRSHIRAWHHCMDISAPVLVLEDDAFLSERLPAFLAEIERLQLPGIVNLETRGDRKRVSKIASISAPQSKVELYHLFIDRGGAAGYVVTPSAAKTLVELSKSRAAPADAFIDISRVPRLQAEPGLVSPIFVRDGRVIGKAFETTIRLPAKLDRLTLFLRHPHFKLRRLAGYISLQIRKLETIGSSVTRMIDVCPTILSYAENRSA